MRDAFFLKPARDVVTFQINGQRNESAARGDDDAGSRGAGPFRKVRFLPKALTGGTPV